MKSIVTRVVLSFLTLVAMCGVARADGMWVNCNRTSGYYQYFDSTTIQVGKDATVGDVLGTWVNSYNPTAWTCSHRPIYQSYAVPMTVQGSPPYTTWSNIQVDGQGYTVYNVPGKVGLGYIARWRYTVKGQTSDWYPLTVGPGVYQTPTQLFTMTDDGSSWNLGADVQIRFVKTSTSLTAGNVPIFDPIYMRHYQVYGGSYSTGAGTYMIAQLLASSVVISTTGGTCTTSDVTVNLPPVSRTDFSSVGYTAARTDFNLNFTNCPAGLSSISYLFTPTTAIINNANGVFSLASASTASGVGIQLLNDQDVPLSFNTAYLLTDYDPTQNNANYTVPLRAGLYQTETNVSSGTINGAVTFTLVYK